VRERRRWPGKDRGKVVPFPGAEECVTLPIALTYAATSICAAITRVAARLGMDTEKEGDVGAVTSLVAAHNDLVAGTRQTVEGSGCK
jgi:hypothetical protein